MKMLRIVMTCQDFSCNTTIKQLFSNSTKYNDKRNKSTISIILVTAFIWSEESDSDDNEASEEHSDISDHNAPIEKKNILIVKVMAWRRQWMQFNF